MNKLSELFSTPKDHQQGVIDHFDSKSDGIVAYHGVGTGKTLTSILAANKYSTPSSKAIIAAPASLLDNYRKEIEKHTKGTLDVDLLSHQKFIKEYGDGKQHDPRSLLVVDEAHRASNLNTKLKKTLSDFKAKKRLLLTATPIYNNPSNLSSLVNIASGNKVLPENDAEFAKAFIRNKVVSPGFLDSIMGVKPGIIPQFKPNEDFNTAVSKHIHYYKNPDNSSDFPSVSHHTVNTELSARQKQLTSYALSELPFHIRRKIKANLPPDRQEAKSMMAFMTGPRQIASSIYGFDKNVSPVEASKDSKKHNIIVDLLKKSPDKKRIIYSNYINSSLAPLSQRLNEEGIPHRLFTGSEDKKERDDAIKRYNNNEEKTLLISSAGAEGLDSKGTNEVHVLEPHWNEQKIKQVVGRAVRFKSHSHLPEDQRHVDVYHYLSSDNDKGFLGLGKKKSTVEEYIKSRAHEKQKLFDQIENHIKRLSEKK